MLDMLELQPERPLGVAAGVIRLHGFPARILVSLLPVTLEYGRNGASCPSQHVKYRRPSRRDGTAKWGHCVTFHDHASNQDRDEWCVVGQLEAASPQRLGRYIEELSCWCCSCQFLRNCIARYLSHSNRINCADIKNRPHTTSKSASDPRHIRNRHSGRLVGWMEQDANAVMMAAAGPAFQIAAKLLLNKTSALSTSTLSATF